MPMAPYAMIPETPDGRNRIFTAPPSNKDRELRSSCSASSWRPAVSLLVGGSPLSVQDSPVLRQIRQPGGKR